MKLKQIKEFNSDTLDQNTAALICSIVVWNHFDEPEYMDQFIIQPHENGIIIVTPLGHRVRIFRTGNLSASIGENQMHMNTQIPLVQLYLKLGFYSIE